MEITRMLAEEFAVSEAIIGNIVGMIDEGCTIPFIARYRKERTNAMDDQKLRELSERLTYLRALDKRRGQIASALAEQGKLEGETAQRLERAQTLAELEDVYRPFKPKRRTRAMIAREKGVEPLAQAVFAQRRGDDPVALAAGYID